jgi:transcriptional regulator with XRE-family HTH domain
MVFSEWLLRELDERGWNQADLARASCLTTAAISRLMNGSRGIGPDACNAIANAFKLPPEIVFRKAGLLPLDKEEIPGMAELCVLVELLDDDDRQELLEIARLKLERQEREKDRKARGALRPAEN